jgi:hypothetical protein
MAWSYCLAAADAPTYTCTPSCLCASRAQEPSSPSLESSQSPGPPAHRIARHSSHLGSIPASSHQCRPRAGIAGQLGELRDVLVHGHGPLFQILKLFLLQLDHSLGNMMCTESSPKFRLVDAFRLLVGFHISIPPVGCRTQELVSG